MGLSRTGSWFWALLYGGGVSDMSEDTLPWRLDVRLNQGQYFRSILVYFEMVGKE